MCGMMLEKITMNKKYLGVSKRHLGLSKKNRATSLVEVIVVMVVLIVGIFAVMRMFPYGLNYLKTAGSRTNASRVANNFLAQVQADAANLPESITPVWYDGGTRYRVLGIDPDDLKKIADPVGGVNFSDINKARYVSNEPITIAPGTQQPVYLLKYGPMVLPTAQGLNPPSNAAEQLAYDQFLKVTSAPFLESEVHLATINPSTRVEKQQLLKVNEYLVDYNTGGSVLQSSIYFSLPNAPLGSTRRFDVRFEVRLSPTVTRTMVVKSVNIAMNSWVDNLDNILGPGMTANLVPGSLVIVRDFDRLPTGSLWTLNDPYQYKLVTENVNADTNFGRLVFNPESSTLTQRAAQGEKTFKARVSYAVYDWHILHEDKEVSSTDTGAAGEIPLRLGIPDLKKRGETERNTTTYGGLVPNFDQDILVFAVDPLDGTLNSLTSGRYNSGSPTPANAHYWVEYRGKESSYKTGVIYINSARVSKGTKLRVYYRASGDWGVSLHKAATEYVQQSYPMVPVTVSGLPVAPLGYEDPFFMLAPEGIVFDRSEYNKTVTINLDVNGVRRTQLFNINNVKGLVSYIKRSDVDAVAGGAWRVIGSIKGTSAKARVIWKDDKVGTDSSEKWQKQDVDVYLTQE
jgi:type II secretory pathway pseudopilin PulG